MRIVILIAALLFLPERAYAMHIAEGILPAAWAGIWYAVAAPFFFYGLMRLKKISADDFTYKPLAGLLAAVVFIISAMPVPVPVVGSVSHPCGTGLTAVLLGPGISVVIAAAALLMQALFMAHGGLSTLGGNVFAMGVVGSIAGYLAFRAMRGFGLFPAAFVAGVVADWTTYMATAAVLSLGIRGEDPFGPLFIKIIIAFIPAQVPIGILEGFVTAGMVSLLMNRRPDILIKLKIMKPGKEAHA